MLKITKIELLTLLLIIILGFFLRVYRLGNVPSSLYWDEAAMALDAKSISQTGKDYHGNTWFQPIYPSWGDYKLPGYILTAVPSLKFFSRYPEFAVRLPSAIAGTLTILLIYLLTKELFNGKLLENKLNRVSLVSAFLLAISPWHLQFSRTAFEANLALFFNMSAIWLFLKTKSNKLFLVPAAFFSIAGIYTYYSSRFVLPAILILVLIVYLNSALLEKRNIISYFFFGLMIMAAILPLKFNNLSVKAEQFRLSTKSIFNNQEIIAYSTKLILEDNNFLSKKFHHRFLYQAKDLTAHIFDYFSFKFLAISGDENLRHSTTSVGVLLVSAFIFLIFGEYYLFNEHIKLFIFLNLSFIICLLPASAAYENPHALRSLNGVIFLNTITAFGFIKLININKLKYFSLLLFIVLTIQFLLYLHDYYVHYPSRSYLSWQSGYKQAVLRTEEEYAKADKIIFTDYYARAFIYYFLYGNFSLGNIQKYRQNILTNSPFNYESTTFDKIEFRSPRIDDQQSGKTLIIASPLEFSGKNLEKINDTFVLWKNY